MNEVQSTPTEQNQQTVTSTYFQNPGGNNLSSTGGEIQNPSNVVDDSENLSITSVSNGVNTTPVKLEYTTTTSSVPQANNSSAKTIGIIGISALVIVVIFFITWLMSRREKEY